MASTPRNFQDDPLRVSAIIPAFNEEQNLPQLLRALATARGDGFRIVEILVVASGCTDGTVDAIRAEAARDGRIRPIVEPRRTGKAAALQRGFDLAVGEVFLVENADTIPLSGSIEALLAPFRSSEVGFAAAHPRPAPAKSTVAARLGRTLWNVHTFTLENHPRASEAYAIRRPPFRIPSDIGDDDTFVGESARHSFPKSVFVEEAWVQNRAPGRVRELVAQRMRINRQVASLRRRTGIRSPSWDAGVIARAVAHHLAAYPRDAPWLAALGAVEAISRATGLLLAWMPGSNSRSVWEPIGSTKPALPVLGSADPSRASE